MCSGSSSAQAITLGIRAVDRRMRSRSKKTGFSNAAMRFRRMRASGESARVSTKIC